MDKRVAVLWRLSIKRLADYGIVSLSREDLARQLGVVNNKLMIEHLTELGYWIDPEDDDYIKVGEDGPDIPVYG